VISKEFYIKCIDFIKNQQEKYSIANKALNEIGIEVDIAYNPLEELFIESLELSLDDKDEWTSWFIYETDFGKKDLKALYDNGKYIMKSNTPEDIYDIITNNPTLFLNKSDKK
jgi:hypothetical protein